MLAARMTEEEKSGLEKQGISRRGIGLIIETFYSKFIKEKELRIGLG